MTLKYPRPPNDMAIELAREILGSRFMANHKDLNRMLATLRGRGLDTEHGLFGESSALSKPVLEFVADANLQAAPQKAIERKIAALQRQIGASSAASLAKIDITRLGGRGAAGRQRDQARASEHRDIDKTYLSRLKAELLRREVVERIL